MRNNLYTRRERTGACLVESQPLSVEKKRHTSMLLSLGRLISLDKLASSRRFFIPVDAKQDHNLSLDSMLDFVRQRFTNWIALAMKKRRESDFIKQVISSKRSLNNAVHKRQYNRHKSDHQRSISSPRSIVLAPATLSLFEKNYNAFSIFINDLKEKAETGRVLIDFTKVRSAKVSAILVLYANIEQLQKIHKDRSIVKTTGVISRETAIMFRTFGLWNLTRESRINPNRAYPDSLEICTMAHEANAAADHKAELRKVLKYAQSSVQKFGMHEGSLLAYNAITESISNVWQHAYDDMFFDVPVPVELRNWWIIVQCIHDQFFVSMYDMGIGIPATIDSKPWAAALIESITKLLEGTRFQVSSPDAKSIKAAVDYGKSRFKQDNRGKGLTEAKDFVQRNPHGSLFIFSGSGHYAYRTKDDNEELEPLSSPFQGTLIQWNLKLEKKDEA